MSVLADRYASAAMLWVLNFENIELNLLAGELL